MARILRFSNIQLWPFLEMGWIDLLLSPAQLVDATGKVMAGVALTAAMLLASRAATVARAVLVIIVRLKNERGMCCLIANERVNDAM
jgi:hypothetical protein